MRTVWLAAWRERRIDALALGAALCAVPVSIAVAETLLGVALVARIAAAVRAREAVRATTLFWFWLLWAGLEAVSWLHSPRVANGTGEIRHLLLIAALFLVIPTLCYSGYRLAVWKGIFITASVGSLALIAGFVVRMIRYRHEIAGTDPSLYLRSGGILHHWMIYSVVEILVFAALLQFHSTYPEQRRWTRAALAINCLAIVLSLTRALWVGCLVLAVIHLVWRRSRWLCTVPLMPALVFLAAPQAVRYRAVESFQPDYYSNTERLQMLRVGWKMIREHPVFGVGPGRVESLYTAYLSPGDPIPAYHGHLHNDPVHLAAQFGLPVLGAAVLFLAMLARALREAYRRAADRETRFLCSTALLGLAGFLLAGLTDYTYGHSLGLILLSFVVLSPLQEVQASTGRRLHRVEHLAMESGEAEPCPANVSRCAADGSEPIATVG